MSKVRRRSRTTEAELAEAIDKADQRETAEARGELPLRAASCRRQRPAPAYAGYARRNPRAPVPRSGLAGTEPS